MYICSFVGSSTRHQHIHLTHPFCLEPPSHRSSYASCPSFPDCRIHIMQMERQGVATTWFLEGYCPTRHTQLRALPCCCHYPRGATELSHDVSALPSGPPRKRPSCASFFCLAEYCCNPLRRGIFPYCPTHPILSNSRS